MLRSFALVALPVLLVGASKPSHAAIRILDGNSLYTICSSRNAPGPTICESYIRGIFETLTIKAAALPWNDTKFCVRSTVTHEQVRDIVVAYMRDHPRERDGFAFALVERAIFDAFPACSPEAAGK